MRYPNFLRQYGLISALINHICIGRRTVGKNAEMHTISTKQASIIQVLPAILKCLVVKVPCFFCDRLKAKLNSQWTYSLLDQTIIEHEKLYSKHVLFDFPYFPFIMQEYCHGKSSLYVMMFFFFRLHVDDRLMLSNLDFPNGCVSGKRSIGKARWCTLTIMVRILLQIKQNDACLYQIITD